MSLPPATDFRPLGLRLLNTLFPRVWNAGVLPYPDLQESTLDAMAIKSTGLSDFGDDSFARRQLRELLPALESEAQLNPMGRVIAHGTLLKSLKERLWAQDLFKRHPEILERPLAPPIVVIGQMRSGTTRLQRLLGQDPRFAALRLYESMSPVPWPSSQRNPKRDPRVGYTQRAFAFLNYINPGIAATHPTGALEIDEELGLLDASFTGAAIEAQRRVPSFARYCEATDQTPAYQHLRRLLQLASWFRGQDPATPFVLKMPQHMQDLPALMAVFPDAKLVFIHRDPAAVLGSSASMVWNQMVVQSDSVDPHWIGAEWLHKAHHRAAVTAALRPKLAAAQQIDVRFADMNADWVAVMRRIYDFLGVPFDATAHAAMAAYLARAAREHRHDEHRYTLEDFGLDARVINAGFADYRARFDIPFEVPAAMRGAAIAQDPGYGIGEGVPA